MFGTQNYNPYGGYPMNMAPAQQRLAQMEAQYPQFASGNVNPYPQVSGPITPPQGPQAGLLKGRVVTSIDEVRGAMIDLDGGIHVFPDPGNHKIYTKQINLDGTSTVNTYSLDPPGGLEPHQAVDRAEFESTVGAITNKIGSLESQLKEVLINVQSYAGNGDAKLPE